MEQRLEPPLVNQKVIIHKQHPKKNLQKIVLHVENEIKWLSKIVLPIIYGKAGDHSISTQKRKN